MGSDIVFLDIQDTLPGSMSPRAIRAHTEMLKIAHVVKDTGIPLRLINAAYSYHKALVEGREDDLFFLESSYAEARNIIGEPIEG